MRVALLLALAALLVTPLLTGCEVATGQQPPADFTQPPAITAGPDGASGPNAAPAAPAKSEDELLLEEYGYNAEALGKQYSQAVSAAGSFTTQFAKALAKNATADALEPIIVSSERAIALALASRPTALLATQLAVAQTRIEVGELTEAKSALKLAKALAGAIPNLENGADIEASIVLGLNKVAADTMDEAAKHISIASKLMPPAFDEAAGLKALEYLAGAKQALAAGQTTIASAYADLAIAAIKEMKPVAGEAAPAGQAEGAATGASLERPVTPAPVSAPTATSAPASPGTGPVAPR